MNNKSFRTINYLSYGCAAILLLNTITGINYLGDFFLGDRDIRFVNTSGVTGNKDLIDVTTYLNASHPKQVSLFFTNGLETAWAADPLRTIPIDKASHNEQIMQEAEFNESFCSDFKQQNWSPTGLLVVTNPNSTLSDITPAPDGGTVVYKNKSFMVLDPTNLKTLAYVGEGSYPVGFYSGPDHSFPQKFRWIGKGANIFIYSNKPKVINLSVELTPGYLETDSKDRHIIIKSDTTQGQFTFNKRTTLVLPNIQLHAGVNCLTLQSPDKLKPRTRYGSLMRSGIPMDSRLISFAMSRIDF